MNKERIIEKAEKIIAKLFKIDPADIKTNMTPDDIESWDSLGQLMLINDLEKEFCIKFEIEEIFEIMSIEDIYNILERKKR